MILSPDFQREGCLKRDFLKVVHLCIDEQRGQFWQFQDEEAMTVVINSMELKQRLAGLGIQTIYIADINGHSKKHLGVCFGRMKDVCFQVIDKVGVDLSRDPNFSYLVPVQEEDLVAVKPDFSATECPPLMRYLNETQIGTVILSGVFEARDTEIRKACLTVTGATLARRGYHVLIASDATNNHVCRPVTMDVRRAIHDPYKISFLSIDEILSYLWTGSRAIMKQNPAFQKG